MRAVVQRVSEASVTVAGEVTGQIGRGFLVLLGIAADDSEKDVVWIAEKIAGLRVFEDAEGRMNLSLGDVSGAVLLVSQFTLYGVAELRGHGLAVETGRFQAHMDVRLLNDGPVTLLLDSRRQF